MKLHGTEQYGGLINQCEYYMDYEFFRGEYDLWTVTYDIEGKCWYSTYRSADTPDGDYGDPVDLTSIDTMKLRSRIPFGDMSHDYLLHYEEIYNKEMNDAL